MQLKIAIPKVKQSAVRIIEVGNTSISVGHQCSKSIHRFRKVSIGSVVMSPSVRLKEQLYKIHGLDHGRIHLTDSDKCSPWHSYFQCIGPNPLSDYTKEVLLVKAIKWYSI